MQTYTVFLLKKKTQQKKQPKEKTSEKAKSLKNESNCH